jgi:hypothetical protein
VLQTCLTWTFQHHLPERECRETLGALVEVTLNLALTCMRKADVSPRALEVPVLKALLPNVPEFLGLDSAVRGRKACVRGCAVVVSGMRSIMCSCDHPNARP